MVQVRSQKRARSSMADSSASVPPVSAAIKKYVKRVVKSAAEVKHLDFESLGTTLTSGVIKTWNIMYQSGIAHGTSGIDAFIGDRLRLRNIVVEGSISNFNGTYVNEVVHGNLLLIRYTDYYAATSIGNTEIMDVAFTNQSTTTSVFDTRKVQILKKIPLKAAPILKDTEAEARFKLTYDFKDRLVEFRDFDQSFEIKGGNYYLVFQASQLNVGYTSNCAKISFTCKTGFTDE